MNQHITAGEFSGIITIPSSKSDAQRALLAAALADGISLLSNVGDSADELAMLSTIQEMGAQVKILSSRELQIFGIHKFPSEATFNLAESGLGFRLITALCAAHVGKFLVSGTGSLTQRPMTFFEETLPLLHAKIKTNHGFIPCEIQGPMHGDHVSIDASTSSQYLSGLLMALPLLEKPSTLSVAKLNSKPYVQMTLNTLTQFGIEIQQVELREFHIAGNQKYLPTNYIIEGDWSAASYWLVASALGQNIQITGLSLASLQADIALLKAFENANCTLNFSSNGISIDGKNRTAFSFDATDCPDLFPALVTFAALCNGISSILGVHRLKHKESDRGEVLKTEFAKLGVNIELQDDTMYIHGSNTIAGGVVDSHNDHRIAMCLAIAGMFAESTIELINSEAVHKSYTHFWEDLESLRQH